MKTEGFPYTYSSGEQKEIADIRSKYLPKEEDPTYYCPTAHYIDHRACHKGKIKESKLQEIVKTEIFNQIPNCCLRKKKLGFLIEQAFGAARQKCEKEKK